MAQDEDTDSHFRVNQKEKNQSTRLTFVVGKGGVGKTTVSCAYALHLAARHPRQSILLMSTDPAHSLADTLQVSVGSTPKKIKGLMWAWQIDSEKEFRKFLSGNRDAILQIVENGTFFSKEEIAPLLETTLPGMSEVAGLLGIQKLLESGRYHHIVVDTAPFGHTLRLFELPLHFQRFLNFLNVASSRDALLAERFGGRVAPPAQTFVSRWEEMVQQVREAFTSNLAQIFLVTSPETFSLNEAERSLKALNGSVPEMRVGAIVLNRVPNAAGSCANCGGRARMAAKARQFLRRKFAGVPQIIGPDPGNPILGLELLRRFGSAVFENRRTRLEQSAPRAPSPRLQIQAAHWPAAQTPLSFTVGKGGVGKTTTTAALAYHTRAESDLPVTVCSTDPAPSLDDIFQAPVGDKRIQVLGDRRFYAMEVDSVAEFRRWAAGMKRKLGNELSMQSGGLHVDLTFEKEVFAALLDVVPPGVDEVFAIFRILDLVQSSQGRVFIDMAPTGHALELLRMPERILLWSRLLLKSLAAHRTLALAQDVAVELASLGQRVRQLLEMMKDPRQSRVWAVMLPEPVPDRQTARLLEAVRLIGITADSLFVNRVLPGSQAATRCPHCRRRAEWQQAVLNTLQRRYKGYHIYLAPEMPGEIAGPAALKKFTTKLWHIET